MGFRSPSRLVTQSSQWTSRPTAPLLEFLSPTVHQEAGGYVRPAKPVRRPELLARVSLVDSTPPTTVPRAGFLNLLATASSLNRPAMFQAGFTPGVHSSGDCSPQVAPPAYHRRLALLTFLLRTGLCSPLGLESLREALLPLPRIPGQKPLFAFRALSHLGIDLHHRHTINAPVTDLPLLSFHLLMA